MCHFVHSNYIFMQTSKCDVCQCMNQKMTTGAPELHPISMKQPRYMVGIDFVSPLSPQANDGSRYILTLSDYFTKWVEAFPTPDTSAPQLLLLSLRFVRHIRWCKIIMTLSIYLFSADLYANGLAKCHHLKQW